MSRGEISRQTVFFDDQDKETYLELFSTHAAKAGIEIWAYCLMDNHVHFVAVPEEKTSLARGIGVAHKKYTRMIHFRKGWRGYLWQGRFFSVPLSEPYLYAAVQPAPTAEYVLSLRVGLGKIR